MHRHPVLLAQPRGRELPPLGQRVIVRDGHADGLIEQRYHGNALARPVVPAREAVRDDDVVVEGQRRKLVERHVSVVQLQCGFALFDKPWKPGERGAVKGGNAHLAARAAQIIVHRGTRGRETRLHVDRGVRERAAGFGQHRSPCALLGEGHAKLGLKGGEML